MTQAVSVHVKQLKQGCNEDFRYIEVVNLVAVNKPIQKAKKTGFKQRLFAFMYHEVNVDCTT